MDERNKILSDINFYLFFFFFFIKLRLKYHSLFLKPNNVREYELISEIYKDYSLSSKVSSTCHILDTTYVSVPFQYSYTDTRATAKRLLIYIYFMLPNPKMV